MDDNELKCKLTYLQRVKRKNEIYKDILLNGNGVIIIAVSLFWV